MELIIYIPISFSLGQCLMTHLVFPYQRLGKSISHLRWINHLACPYVFLATPSHLYSEFCPSFFELYTWTYAWILF